MLWFVKSSFISYSPYIRTDLVMPLSSWSLPSAYIVVIEAQVFLPRVICLPAVPHACRYLLMCWSVDGWYIVLSIAVTRLLWNRGRRNSRQPKNLCVTNGNEIFKYVSVHRHWRSRLSLFSWATFPYRSRMWSNKTKSMSSFGLLLLLRYLVTVIPGLFKPLFM